MKPKCNIGFTSRGCIRHCEFCIVFEKEGNLKPTGDIYDFWDGECKDLTILDNNILGLTEHFEKICSQIKKEKLKIDFNQGLDLRLVNPENAKALKSLSHSQYKFGFDTMGIENIFWDKLEILRSAGIKMFSCLVLVGFNTTFEEDLRRLNILRDSKNRAYVMRYRPYSPEAPRGVITEQNRRQYVALSRWANNRAWFAVLSFYEWLFLPVNESYRKCFDNCWLDY